MQLVIMKQRETEHGFKFEHTYILSMYDDMEFEDFLEKRKEEETEGVEYDYTLIEDFSGYELVATRIMPS